MRISKQEYTRRRKALMNQMEANSIAVLPAAQAADKYITALFDLADHDQSGDLSVEELAWLLDSVQDHHHDHHAPHAAAPAPNSP